MTICLKKTNTCNISNLSKIKNLEILGFYHYIYSLELNKSIDIAQINKFYGITTKEVKKMLKVLEKNNVIALEIQELDDIILNITMLEETNVILTNYQFGIEDRIYQNLIDNCENQQMQVLKITKYLVDNFEPPFENLKFNINSKEEFNSYLEKIDPLLLVFNYNQSLTNDCVSLLVECSLKYNFSKKMINLLADYTINSNEYKTFNPKFATKVAFSWFKNDITSTDMAIDFIKNVKQQLAQASSRQVKYEEPKFNEVDESTIEVLDEDQLAALLNQVYE